MRDGKGARPAALARRLFIFRVTAILGSAAIAALAGSERAAAEPNTRKGAPPAPGRGVDAVDTDATDRFGEERGGSSLTDRDPTDGAGRGRGLRQGTSDADPDDRPGAGRRKR